MEIIPRYCRNIETTDFRSLWISPENKENFKTFLKQTTQLKSLRVKCDTYRCAIGELLLQEDFNLHDEDVKIGLRKIKYICGNDFIASESARLLKLLPNLKGLGIFQKLSVVLPIVDDDDEIPQKLSKITEFYDTRTRLTSLECFSKFCPKAKNIFLSQPDKKVIENLWKFPLVTEIQIISDDPDYVSEIISLLNKIGKQIKILGLHTSYEIVVIDPNIVHDLCPDLDHLHMNSETFYF